MKIYNYIPMLFLLGASLLASCTQNEELGEETDTLNSFQISVSDKGFQDPTGTRAAENNFATKFADGDAIGVFGVKGTSVVSDIENRKFTLNNGVWELDGKAIEYKSSEFRAMNFHAYYPYNENVKFNATLDDPFATYVSEWEIGNDQSETNYTQYDLMTSTGEAEGERLKGKISFVMEHRMAVVVMKKPTVTYDFTNEGIADYVLTTDFNSFSLQGKSATPYYQESTDTYRFLVKPGEKYEIKTSYTGVEDKEMECVMSFPDGLNKGIAKVYTIADENKYTQELAVGDYLCADGKIVGKGNTAPNNAIGIVFYVGNPQPSVTHPTLFSEAQDALRRDYPNAIHGLAVALNNTEGGAINMNGTKSYSSYISGDEKLKAQYITCNTKTPLVSYPANLGYNNTEALLLAHETNNYTNAYSQITSYRETILHPNQMSPWYIPSYQELVLMASNFDALNKSIIAVNGTQLEQLTGNLAGSYWSSTERNDQTQWIHGMSTSEERIQRRDLGSQYTAYYRMALAF